VKEDHRMAAEATLCVTKKEILSEKWDMIILDEINYVILL